MSSHVADGPTFQCRRCKLVVKPGEQIVSTRDGPCPMDIIKNGFNCGQCGSQCDMCNAAESIARSRIFASKGTIRGVPFVDTPEALKPSKRAGRSWLGIGVAVSKAKWLVALLRFVTFGR
jgi:hypothetical protein